jgi:hypothetical protein
MKFDPLSLVLFFNFVLVVNFASGCTDKKKVSRAGKSNSGNMLKDAGGQDGFDPIHDKTHGMGQVTQSLHHTHTHTSPYVFVTT